jgi:ribosomal protein L9
MKYILVTNTDTFGAFAKIEKVENGYLCDNLFIPDTIAVEATITEVDDAWVNPIELANQKAAFNESQRQKREAAYKAESDPINFMMQRDEATQEEWLAKIAEIKARFPYQE